jgi:hypothetical protein
MTSEKVRYVPKLMGKKGLKSHLFPPVLHRQKRFKLLPGQFPCSSKARKCQTLTCFLLPFKGKKGITLTRSLLLSFLGKRGLNSHLASFPFFIAKTRLNSHLILPPVFHR